MPKTKTNAAKHGSDADQVYADKRAHVVDFVFDARVAAVFPDMIRRSVPGYENLIALLGVVGEQHFANDDGGDDGGDVVKIYDLGCSLGAAMHSLHSRMPNKKIHFIGVDNSQAMLDRCGENLRDIKKSSRVELLHRDIRAVDLESADMVILNFTLQFIAPDDRREVLTRIYRGLKRGGLLLLAEKIAFDAGDEENWQSAMHAQFKLANGYSDLEIAQKRAALENVMMPDTAAVHRARLREAGFSKIRQWFQAFNFCAFAAIK